MRLIRRIRLNRELTQMEASKRAGIPQPTLSDLEVKPWNELVVSRATQKKVEKYFGRKLTNLLKDVVDAEAEQREKAKALSEGRRAIWMRVGLNEETGKIAGECDVQVIVDQLVAELAEKEAACWTLEETVEKLKTDLVASPDWGGQEREGGGRQIDATRQQGGRRMTDEKEGEGVGAKKVGAKKVGAKAIGASSIDTFSGRGDLRDKLIATKDEPGPKCSMIRKLMGVE